MNPFRRLSKKAQFGIMLVIVLVLLWMFVTPFYEVIMTEFSITPTMSVVVGGIGLFVVLTLSKFKFHLW